MTTLPLAWTVHPKFTPDLSSGETDTDNEYWQTICPAPEDVRSALRARSPTSTASYAGACGQWNQVLRASVAQFCSPDAFGRFFSNPARLGRCHLDALAFVTLRVTLSGAPAPPVERWMGMALSPENGNPHWLPHSWCVVRDTCSVLLDGGQAQVASGTILEFTGWPYLDYYGHCVSTATESEVLSRRVRGTQVCPHAPAEPPEKSPTVKAVLEDLGLA